MRGTTPPLRYRVVIEGRIGAHLVSQFDQVELESDSGRTSLRGSFVDQAQLYGLLDWLRDLGIPIVSVHRLEADGGP